MQEESTRTIFIHQPHFLPWLPYFSRIAIATYFVPLDNVQYRKGYFQNRTVLVSPNSHPFWLTIPVHNIFPTQIREVRIAQDRMSAVVRKLKGTYSNERNKIDILYEIIEIIEKGHSFLIDLNMDLIKYTSEMLSLRDIKIVFSSEISRAKDPTERILEICSALGANRIVVGWGKTFDTLRIDELKQNDVRFLLQSESMTSTILTSHIRGLSSIHNLITQGPSSVSRSLEQLVDYSFFEWRPSLHD